MTAQRLSSILQAARRATNAAPPQDGARFSDPMDENTLAAEIARIMERHPAAAGRSNSVTTAPATPRWLGDEEDRAAVEAYVTRAETDGAPDESGDAHAQQAAMPDEPALAVTPDSPAQWVRQARQHRFRDRLREAAGWTVSLTVSLIVMVVAGLAIYGWPDNTSQVRQIRVKTMGVSAISPPTSSPGLAGDKQVASALTPDKP